MSELYQSLAHSKGAGHIVHIFRNRSPFAIAGPPCSRQLFLSCAECIVTAATAWFVSLRGDIRLPSPFG